MKADINEKFAIPEGIQVSLADGTFTVKGPKGQVSRKLSLPGINSKVEGSEIAFSSKNATQREKKIIMTFKAHLKSMFKGVTEGHVYKLKVCSSHFPMTAAVKGSQLEIKNYFGEQIPRTFEIPQGVTVKVDGQVIMVDGVEKELVGQTAAKIELGTKRARFDKRIFQDGIYLTEKDGKPVGR
ncbi:50S ribosomal protein L6 [Candidatus Woesearchaeota archaeon]|nr:50S ribosomal protein L6 [Candidatus Woesearchaeota archaeon]